MPDIIDDVTRDSWQMEVSVVLQRSDGLAMSFRRPRQPDLMIVLMNMDDGYISTTKRHGSGIAE